MSMTDHLHDYRTRLEAAQAAFAANLASQPEAGAMSAIQLTAMQLAPADFLPELQGLLQEAYLAGQKAAQ